MTRTLNLVVVLLCAVAAGQLGFEFWQESRAPHVPPTLLDHVRAYIGRQYHDCIPLGWYARGRSSDTYYPDVNLDVVNYDGPFPGLWVAIVPPARSTDPRVADIQSVMDQLVRAHLLRRADDPRGIRYNLTTYGQQFFYQDDDVTGNPEDWPFLCYSRLRVTHIAWGTSHREGRERGAPTVKQVRVWWRVEQIDDWMTPALRKRTVHLRPAANPVETTVCSYVDGEWAIQPFGTSRTAAAQSQDSPQC